MGNCDSRIPLSLPFIEGMTRATALAAPVVVGTMLRAAALARRKSRWEASNNLWSPVYEWVVVMVPLTMPNLSSKTCVTNTAAETVILHFVPGQ